MVRMKILFFALWLLVIHCDKDSATNPSADHDSYTPLHSGDVTQLISVRDSSTVLLEIGGQVKRLLTRDEFREITDKVKKG